jgi:hypothetical protein
MNISRRDTIVPANVKKGDLIKVYIESKEFIGIVISLLENAMELQIPDGQIRWVSRYVIYEKIQ